MVVGDSKTGHTSSFNVMYWPLKMLSRGMFCLAPADPQGVVDVVPLDYATDAVEAISADPAQRGKCFHIAAGPQACCTVSEFLDLAVEVMGIRRPILDESRAVPCLGEATDPHCCLGQAPREFPQGPSLLARIFLTERSLTILKLARHSPSRPCSAAGTRLFSDSDRICDCYRLGKAPPASGRTKGLPMNFYDLDPAAQQAQSLRGLLRYFTQYVGPYHPFLRRLYRDKAIDLGAIRTRKDILSLPLVHKDNLRANPSLFVLQPGSWGSRAAQRLRHRAAGSRDDRKICVSGSI